jgi:hypothetical protein
MQIIRNSYPEIQLLPRMLQVLYKLRNLLEIDAAKKR